MIKLLTQEQVDVFITEYNSGCVHDWWFCHAEDSKGYDDESSPAHYICKKCPEVRYTSDELTTIDNPIAHSIGKLINYINQKKLFYNLEETEVDEGDKIIGATVTKMDRDGDRASGLTVKYSAYYVDYLDSEAAGCAALGTAVVEVLSHG